MKHNTANNNGPNRPDSIDINATKTHIPNSGKPSRKENPVAILDLFATSDTPNRNELPTDTVTGNVTGNKSPSENAGLYEDVRAAASIFRNINDSSLPDASDENRRVPQENGKSGSTRPAELEANNDLAGEKYIFSARFKNTRIENGERKTTGEFCIQPAKKEKSPAAKRTENHVKNLLNQAGFGQNLNCAPKCVSL